MATKGGNMAIQRDILTTQHSQTPASPSPESPAPGLRVRWDEASVKPSCPTVCNVAGTREQVILSFGRTQPWQAGDPEIPVQLTDRIILSPESASRLTLLLIKALQEYAARFKAAPAPTATPESR